MLRTYHSFLIVILTKKQKLLNTRSFDELQDIEYGKIGTPKRSQFEKRAQYFVISEMLKEARRQANMTQEQLAEKIGTKKSYISRLENGKCDIQLSTLYRIFEDGLGKKISLIFS
ncbi:MAG: XRE family transcriptional regulator [Bacteroidetes bacterium]|nr:MAG: XRE family transcriptional regulator [Bacteroidota bacterium]